MIRKTLVIVTVAALAWAGGVLGAWLVFERGDVVCGESQFLIDGQCRDSGIRKLKSRLQVLEAELVEREVRIDQLIGQRDALKGRSGSLANQLADLSDEVANLSGQLSQHQECVDAHVSAHDAALRVLQNGEPDNVYYRALEPVAQECEGLR
jgi:hypothetical protein